MEPRTRDDAGMHDERQTIRRRIPSVAAKGSMVVAASLALGGATSFAQSLLPAALVPIANSSGGWTLLTALLIWCAGERAVPSALYGALSFAALVLGYQLVSGLRGFPTSEERFLMLALVAGPFVGVAASWLRLTGFHAALGAGLLAGIAIGEGVYGLTRIMATTGWVWWTTLILLGVALVVVVLARVARRPPEILVALGSIVLVSVALNGAYILLG